MADELTGNEIKSLVNAGVPIALILGTEAKIQGLMNQLELVRGDIGRLPKSENRGLFTLSNQIEGLLRQAQSYAKGGRLDKAVEAINNTTKYFHTIDDQISMKVANRLSEPTFRKIEEINKRVDEINSRYQQAAKYPIVPYERVGGEIVPKSPPTTKTEIPKYVSREEKEAEVAELQKKLLEAQTRLAEKQLAAAGGGEGSGKTTVIPGPQTEELAKYGKKLKQREHDFAPQLKHESKKLGMSLGIATIPAAAIVLVAYFVMNSWIALGVNLLPAPVGPLLNSLWWITYLAIGLISWAVLSQGSSPGQILISGILIAFVLGLVGWLVNGIFAPFLEPFLGPGLTCTLATMKAQQQGGAIPPECQEQSGTPIADKTGSVNLLTASLGQSGAPFPQPRKDSTYQFPITIANPSEFDIGPVVVENGYMCGKVGGYTKCGSYDGTIFVADYRMKGNSCVKPEDNCIVGVGGPPLVVSMVGDENNPKGDIVPFDSSYVNLYVNVRYPFITSGTNDFYIAQTYRDVPKNIQACEGSGVRPLGKACTGSGPINVIPYFSPTHISLDQWNGALQPVTLTVAVSNVGNGVARVKSIEIVRFSSNINDGLNVLPDAGWVCRLSGSDSITFNEENKVAKFAEFLQNNLKAEGDTISQPAMQLEISSKESANFICNYALAGNVREILTGPYMTIKSEAKVNYDYYETPSKTDVLVQSKLA